jgi:hypothetical protein
MRDFLKGTHSWLDVSMAVVNMEVKEAMSHRDLKLW